jgi:ABC-type branched-subunit amino acid transport system ATPase component
MPYPSISKQNTRAIVLLTQFFDFTFELADKIYALKRVEVVYGSKRFTIG